MKKRSNLCKKIMIYIFPALALLLSLYAKETSKAARDAIYLCLDVVIPSLFPFFVLSRLTVPFLKSFSCPGFLRRLVQGLIGLPYYILPTIVLGYLSGYPTGAKLARDMMDEGLLDSNQASRVIAMANNCSPLFIIGTIGAGLFRSIRIGFILLAIHWVSGLIAALVLNRVLKKGQFDMRDGMMVYNGRKSEGKTRSNLAAIIPGAIEDAAILSIKVTGYIVLFAVLSELLYKVGFFTLIGHLLSAILPESIMGNSLTPLLRGVMEITSGSNAIAQSVNMSVVLQLSLVSLICGFAGFSVHTQVMGIMKGTGTRYRVFLLGKILHGVTACLLTLAALSLLPISLVTSSLQPSVTGIPSYFRIFTLLMLIIALVINPYENGGKIRHSDRPGL